MGEQDNGQRERPDEHSHAGEGAQSANGTPKQETENENELSLEERQAKRIEELEEELEAAEEKFLRKAAELENYRRRQKQARQQGFEKGRRDTLEAFLDVYDDFQRTIEAAEQTKEEEEAGPAFRSLKEGVELVFKKFEGEMDKLGVKRIEAKGNPFDEQLHDAMMQQEASDDVPSGTVIQEVQPGYMLDDQVLRHAKVIVAK